jgi:superfamily I DNA/RNA helicase
LTAEPRIVVSTIHRVKGGEAEHVVLLPDLSQNPWSQLHTDEEQRVLYVAVTRAKETLTICKPQSNRHYSGMTIKAGQRRRGTIGEHEGHTILVCGQEKTQYSRYPNVTYMWVLYCETCHVKRYANDSSIYSYTELIEQSN